MAKRGGFTQWLAEQRRTYLENATAMRDFRVQLRGNRPIFIFGGYLAVLMFAAGIAYWTIATGSSINDGVARIQELLSQFYAVIIGTIAAMLFIIAPALTATAVVSERSRKSLDLVFCAPVEPKYFLVGKLIASYRYVWMLLFLSIPVTATCVVFGGASWVDVLLNYVQLSLLGMMITALSLCVSTVAQKPVGAILWSYLGSAGLLGILGLIGAGSPETSPLSALSPLGMLYSSGSFVSIGILSVPAFVVTAMVTGLISKLLLHAAGNLLAPHNPRAAISLRLHALAYTWFTIGVSAYFATQSFHEPVQFDVYPTSEVRLSLAIAVLLGWMLIPLSTLMPILSTFSLDDERVHRPNGWFSLRRVLSGTPAGALPFIQLLIGGCFVSATLGVAKGGMHLDWGVMAPYVVFISGFWSFLWAIGRAVSVIRPSLKEARTLQFIGFIVTVILPAPFLAVFQTLRPNLAINRAWDFYILRPILEIGPGEGFYSFGTAATAWTAIVWIAAVTLFGWSEAKMRDRRRYQLPHSLEAFGEDQEEPWTEATYGTKAKESDEVRLNA